MESYSSCVSFLWWCISSACGTGGTMTRQKYSFVFVVVVFVAASVEIAITSSSFVIFSSFSFDWPQPILRGCSANNYENFNKLKAFIDVRTLLENDEETCLGGI
eukprot:m.324626 g.324626  ORF g.324626 m.324626 type:complete len:104 (-) comp16543_c0_seq5:74-385(-)